MVRTGGIFVVYKRSTRKKLMLILDSLLINFAYFGSLMLRFDGNIPQLYLDYYVKSFFLVTIIVLLCFYKFDIYDRLWRFASTNEMFSILSATTIASLLMLGFTYMLRFLYPRSIYLLFWLLLTALISGYRFMLRVFFSHSMNSAQKGKSDAINVMIIGAGDAASVVVEEFLRHPGLKRRPIVLIDDNKNKHGMKIRGVPVEGGREAIPQIVFEKSIQEIIIAMPSADRRDIREIVQICNKTKCNLKILPGIYELIDGRVTVKRLRDVKIEDLLGRDPVKVDIEEISNYIRHKKILVTGGGGSIGSELCRQIARFNPKQLLIFDINENNIYDLEYDLNTTYPNLKYKSIIGTVREAARLESVFKEYRPDIVFHAAAHKHVPLMEQNPLEAIKNNVFGTLNAAQLSDRYQVEKFILISTDKAVNPTSIMGATKRIAEIIIQMQNKDSNTTYSAVRFGNVLGSRGSVVPLFKKQIEAAGPVTVTHPEIMRYFMTIPEAVQLVIQAGALAKGGEIFILDMGDPVKIDDLAKDMIRLSGLKPGEDIQIKYTGLRPGEKLFEELLLKEEGIAATKNDRIYIAKPTYMDAVDFSKELDQLKKILSSGRATDAAKVISNIVPMYREMTEQKRGYGALS
ncbi:MAG: nucleoside-diphosphate sugar epimerase/dehydratase [Eubacteriales bacterium]|nr:nucleoside-diphosphate sugar epimerase/dehydratase [Eubacteriales bacterium]